MSGLDWSIVHQCYIECNNFMILLKITKDGLIILGVMLFIYNIIAGLFLFFMFLVDEDDKTIKDFIYMLIIIIFPYSLLIMLITDAIEWYDELDP